MRYRCCLFFLCLLGVTIICAAEPALTSFATGGHTVYHIRFVQVRKDVKSVVGGCYDGAVVCYSVEGKRLWINEEQNGFPTDLAVLDSDKDGLDEVFVSYANGVLAAIDDNGKTLWTFVRPAPLIQVCAAKLKSGEVVILTGGTERILFALSSNGRAFKEKRFEYAIRHVRCGNMRGDGVPYAAVVESRTDNSRLLMHLLEPASLQSVWDKPVPLKTDNPTVGTNFEVEWLGNKAPAYSMLVEDLTGDGRDEIVLSSSFEKRGVFRVHNSDGKLIYVSKEAPSRRSAYRQNLLAAARIGGKERVVGIFGNELLVYRPDGSVEQSVEGPYAYTSLDFDAETSTCCLGSSVAGGDGIYLLGMGAPGWPDAFKNAKGVGRIVEVKKNLEVLAGQVDRFARPSYQKEPGATRVVTGRNYDEIRQQFLGRQEYKNVEFILFTLFTEDYDRSSLKYGWDKKRESRHKYNYSAEQIVEFCREREKLKEPFAVWAGHGNDPFYMQLSTLEKMISAAPAMLKYLVFPEMEHTDEAMAYAVREHIIPVSRMCRKQGTTKIILRCKNVFWNASYRLDLWGPTLLSGEYRDVFVPSMEETNGRTQAISLSGRTGLWLGGYFDSISTRVVTDNACWSRFWEYGAQQTQSHLLRALVLGASLGSDAFLVNIYQGDQRDLTPFYRMIDKGVIAIPGRDDLLSVNEVCLAMRDPSRRFLEHGKNGHDMSGYQPGEKPMVFDRMDCYWGGADTAGYDFSRYAMGSSRRMLNFLPVNPYGFIATVPVEADLTRVPRLRVKLETDGEFFYNKKGEPVSAPDFKERAIAALEQGAGSLPVLVKGDVAWTVVRIDPTHVRITLIDPGYISPAERQAEIVLQHLDGVLCRDIFTGEEWPVEKSVIRFSVPAGSIRVLDVEHR